MNAPVLAIVVPCYKEEAVLPETTERLSAVIDSLISNGMISDNSYVCYVNDGSSDNTWPLIKEYHETRKHFAGINLAGNVGHQNALMAGLHTVKDKCDIAISIDADLQDDVNVIGDMVKKYEEGCDIVYGVRKSRETDTWFKRNTALGFYKLMRSMGVKSVYNHADYRLMSRRALQQLSNYNEVNLFIRGIVPLLGYKTDCVYYDRAERFAGESKYPLAKMFNFAIDGITSFSVKPVRLIFNLGLIFILIAFCVFIYTMYSYIKGAAISGWTSLILSIWFTSGCLLISLGIIGEYIGKIYTEVKARPRYNIESILLADENKE
ncbi:MAG: glycosyltransferase family 2 protein [Bacteroidales bacterium]|nr:glycosyltransferase family 2 protein [Bacteroidales bacterium]